MNNDSLRWHFKRLEPGDTIREPIQGEFFSTEAISGAAEALVREAIQNSLDAGTQSIRIRIFHSGSAAALSSEAAAYYFGDAWSHYMSPKNGLVDAPSMAIGCPFLVIEDFGTTGLIGDPGQWYKLENQENGFFNFFRAEGQSDKGAEDRGRWGVGKFVFPRSSQVSSYLAATKREGDESPLVMGRAILKSHVVAGFNYVPDGYLGEMRNDKLVLPFRDAKMFERLRSDFKLQRQAEPGLSVIIPWSDPDITPPALLTAVVRSYFYPILNGTLLVSIESASGVVELKPETLLDEANSEIAALPAEARALAELAKWSLLIPAQSMFRLESAPVERPKWLPTALAPAVREELSERLRRGDPVAIRVPLTVRKKTGDPVESYFDVYMRRDSRCPTGKSIFVREGITISDVRSPRTPGVAALVVIEDAPLATLLGDSENPSHTQWQKDGSNFRGRYIYGGSYLQFVTNAPSEIHRLLSEADQMEDRTLLADIFTMPPDMTDDTIEVPQKGETKKSGVPESIPPLPNLDPPIPRLQVQLSGQGGFRVSPAGASLVVPGTLVIEVAYDVRRGDPFVKYSSVDFEFGEPPISIGPGTVGCQLLTAADNRVVMSVTSNDFVVQVNGFDPDRDLCVRAAYEGSAET